MFVDEKTELRYNMAFISVLSGSPDIHSNTSLLQPMYVCSCLQSVCDNEGLRKAYEEIQPENVKLGLRLSQSK